MLRVRDTRSLEDRPLQTIVRFDVHPILPSLRHNLNLLAGLLQLSRINARLPRPSEERRLICELLVVLLHRRRQGAAIRAIPEEGVVTGGV